MIFPLKNIPPRQLVGGVIASLLDLVGGTPLLSLNRLLGAARDVRLLAKAEHLNPGGSVKDRAARAMLLEGLDSGRLKPGKTIIDATSGNTGISLAMMGAHLGYEVILYLPANANRERKALIRLHGASIVETDPLESSDGAYLAVIAEIGQNGEKYFFPDQYNNRFNSLAHYQTTALEILEQTGGDLTHFVCAMGTSGTFMGTARRLGEAAPNVRRLAVQPDSPIHAIEGVKHMASTIRPGIYDEKLIDETVTVSTLEAWRMTRLLAKQYGLLVGVSSGANVAAAIKVASDLPAGSTVVTILADSGTRYLGEAFWSED
ncbi:MAG: cysteine synthase family protein [Deltaproteobacteria bacterium]|jgi:cysteine synthase B|nr:cysteine synthase family protein [Deltaproteobacteria bacterium]